MALKLRVDTPVEADLIVAIAKRARTYYDSRNIDRELIDIILDVTATHCNGCPLRLADLLGADDFNFMHDIGGIYRHLDRETGKLGGYFLPRFWDKSKDPEIAQLEADERSEAIAFQQVGEA